MSTIATPTPDAQHLVGGFQERFAAIEREVGKVIVGQKTVVRQTLLCMLIGGHALLEGVPGLGKTLLVRTLAQVLDLQFSRIQFTPDLMPADIVGTSIVINDPSGQRVFQFQPGPIFGNLVLADEINRATPKTQSALLEAMAEGSVSVSRKTHRLGEPFFVLATQNPLEMEGTYPLPEAQLDRFAFKILVPAPELADLITILDRTTGTLTPTPEKVLDGPAIQEMKQLVRAVPVADHVKDYIGRVVLATHPDSAGAPEATRKFIRFGASPRAAQAIMLAARATALQAGRPNVAFEDVQAVALPALRHRVILNFEGQAEGMVMDRLLEQILSAVPTARLP
jgi:MoxR-like ATPase